ncbi:hypothetical protein FOCG_13837 [Fusarium oxysporum f. sp. radicis-lycopersici 26381]|nr:hypothetical protein FOCG_13837 [Fusarium oxysporum f. sp. radicis-lycopersici 26381]
MDLRVIPKGTHLGLVPLNATQAWSLLQGPVRKHRGSRHISCLHYKTEYHFPVLSYHYQPPTLNRHLSPWTTWLILQSIHL